MAATDAPKPSEIVSVSVSEEKGEEIEAKRSYKSKAKLWMPKKLVSASKIAFILSILCFMLSLPILFSIIWLIYVGDYECEKILGLSRWSIWIEVGLFLVFLVSNVIIWVRVKLPIPGCFVAATMFAFSTMVGLGMAGNFGSQAGHKLPASPVWLKMKIDRLDTWSDIKHCIYDTRVCDDLITRSTTIKSYEFTRSKLSPLESGCCKPPGDCEMEYVNATYWKRGRVSSRDCKTWENNSTSMCFDCQSCKDAFLWTIETKWKYLGVFIVAISILLLLFHLCLFFATLCETCAAHLAH